MGPDRYRSLSLALGEGRALKDFSIDGYRYRDEDMEEQSIIDIIEALKMHPNLEKLSFQRIALGSKACAAFVGLLRQSAGLQRLDLTNNGVNDLDIEALVGGLAHCRRLCELNISQWWDRAKNPSISVRGWRAVAAMCWRIPTLPYES